MAGRGDSSLVVIDSAGKVASVVGRQGEGPGEFRVPVPVALSDTAVVAFDLQLLKIAHLNRVGGGHRELVRFTAPVMPVASLGERGFLLLQLTANGAVPVLASPEHPDPKPVVSFSDSSVKRMFAPVGGRPQRMTIGYWADGVIVANGTSYEVALFDWEGHKVHAITRQLPQNLPGTRRLDAEFAQLGKFRGPDGKGLDPVVVAQQKEAVAKKPMPFFSHVSAIRMDAKSRLWILGAEGDSAFADVFSSTAFIGRIGIGCDRFSGRWALAGDWLALVCAAPEDAPVDAVFTLYRIVD